MPKVLYAPLHTTESFSTNAMQLELQY